MPYTCDRCGACCRFPIIDVTFEDVLREPRIREVTTPRPGLAQSDPYEFGALLACGRNRPCPFVGADNLCGIYATRPAVCSGFPAGSELCQEARAAHGLPALLPSFS